MTNHDQMDCHAKRGRMTGPEHFRAAEGLLYDAWNERDYHDPRTQAGVGHALLANAAATALAATSKAVGDSDEVTEWARIVQPSAMAEAIFRERREATKLALPKFWPPQHGDTWVDPKGDKWLCESNRGCEWLKGPYLVCLTRQGDDGADEVNRRYGPLELYSRPGTTRDVEVPF